MPVVKTLYKICTKKVASLLLLKFWSEEEWFKKWAPKDGNPFCSLPTGCVDDAFRVTVQLYEYIYKGRCFRPTVSEFQLRPLLTSWRIVNLEISEVEIHTGHLESILLQLSKFSRYLKSVKVHVRLLNGHFKFLSDRYVDPSLAPFIATAFEELLSTSPDLTKICTNLPFDLNKLQANTKLQSLELGFFPGDLDQLNKLVLKQLEVVTLYKSLPFTNDVVRALQQCPKLRFVDGNVLKALEHLHGPEIDRGDAVSRQYDLEIMTLNQMCTKSLQVIATTCPNITQLYISLQPSRASLISTNLDPMKKLKKLKLLQIRINGRHRSVSYTETIQPVLRTIGRQLVQLIISASDIDFHILAKECPNLSLLNVHLNKDTTSYNKNKARFRTLERLHLTSSNASVKETSLKILLTHCTDICHLHLKNIANFTDDILTEILQVNPLVHLKTVVLFGCSITNVGQILLSKACPNLEILECDILDTSVYDYV